MEFSPNSLLCSSHGGQLDIVSADGEWLASVAVPPGRVPAREYLELLPFGAYFKVSEGLSVLEPRSGFGALHPSRGHYETAANPDFKPCSAFAQEYKLRQMMQNIQAHTDNLDRKMQAYGSIERMPVADAEPDLIEVEVKPAHDVES